MLFEDKTSPSKSPASGAETVEGVVNRIHFFNEETLFTIAVLDTESGQVTVLGSLGVLHPGEKIKARGRREEHPKFGEQFRAVSCEVELPVTPEAVESYLASGLFKGVGPALARRITAKFGVKTLEILEEEPEKLLKVKGISRPKLARIQEDWQKNVAHRRVMMFLSSHGVSLAYATRILSAYGDQAVSVLTSNPYRLADDVEGIGFVTADALARKMGIPRDADIRVEAGLVHVLVRAADQGHFYVPEADLLEEARGLLGVDSERAAGLLEKVAAEGRVHLEESGDEVVDGDGSEGEGCSCGGGCGKNVFLPVFLAVERALSRRILAFLSVPPEPPPLSGDEILEKVLKGLAIHLSETQLNVLTSVLENRMCVITGGPGTGKTTLIRSVQMVFESLGRTTALAAPTGRAAKRLTEVTGRDAATIHRLLGYDFATASFNHDESEPLDQDVIIVDEASMVDTFLMHHLFAALSLSSTLILVGDVNQLPPVGPGNALRDIMASGRVPVFTLEEVFRQARESLIVKNAHRVNRGLPTVDPPKSPDGEKFDFYFIEENNAQRMQSMVLALCLDRIPEAFELDGRTDIQVITPMHKGPAGTIEMNRLLQEAMNPGAEELEHLGRTFRVGDKVMQVKNNYSKEVYNGDIGTLISVNREASLATVEFDKRVVTYDFPELEELTLAYAISVHKSQGSEYPAVVFLLSMSHYPLLQRNLVYTGITRAKKLLVLLGSRRALETALANDRPNHRRTRLAQRLADGAVGA
ncbi:MAG: ATP-dependent RecD-like DNA helicase [Pseudomonadota bacterium]